MSILAAILLGIVQGVTEFLPVSSSGHLSILQNFFHFSGTEGHLFFDVLLHVGTLVSICIVYRKDLAEMLQGCKRFVHGEHTNPSDGKRLLPGVRQIVMILLSTLPLVLFLPFKDKLESLYYKTGFIGFALLATGALLYIGEHFVHEGRKGMKTMTVKDALLIGLAQGFALFPGLSRSGTTITVARTLGIERNYAVRYSLLMSIPAVAGSALMSLLSAFRAGITWSSVPAYLVGMVVASAVGVGAIKLMSRLMKDGKFRYFSYYCLGVGALVILLSIFF